MVPCSISSEIGKSSLDFKNNDNPGYSIAVESFDIGKKVPPENIHSSCDQSIENIWRKEQTNLSLGDICINPIVRRQTKSLMEYSKGLPANSPHSQGKCSDNGVEEGEGNEVLVYGIQNVTCNNSINIEGLLKPLPVESMPGCTSTNVNEEYEDMRLLAVDQRMSCSNTSNDEDCNKEPLFRSRISCAIPTNNEENHLRKLVGRHFKDYNLGNDENRVEMHIHHKQDTPKSPLVLCHRTRRFRAPKLPDNDLPTDTQADNQVCGSGNIYRKGKEVPQGPLHGVSNIEFSARKRVCFADADIKPRSNKSLKRNPTSKICGRVINRPGHNDEEQGITSQEVKERLTNCRLNGRKRSIFQGLNFLLTRFSKKKEQEIEGLLWKHGGMVLSDIPTPLTRSSRRSSFRSYAERLPVVICSRKLQTTTFLYGCAVTAFLLKAGWAYDSIKAGFVLPPYKYEVLSNRTNRVLNQIGKSIFQNDNDYIFVKVGVMLHGTHSFCTKFAKVIKHGQGLVSKSLQWLVQSLDKKKISVGAIVVEEENRASRHLKKYASEQKMPVMPASWIINSLHEGKLLPLQEKINPRHPPRPPAIKVPITSVFQDWSQEI